MCSGTAANQGELLNLSFSEDISKYSFLLVKVNMIDTSTNTETIRGNQILVPVIELLMENRNVNVVSGLEPAYSVGGNGVNMFININKTELAYTYVYFHGAVLTNPNYIVRVYGIN